MFAGAEAAVGAGFAKIAILGHIGVAAPVRLGQNTLGLVVRAAFVGDILAKDSLVTSLGKTHQRIRPAAQPQ